MMDRGDVGALADKALALLLESRTFDPQVVLRTGSGTTGRPPMLVPRTLETYSYPIGAWVQGAERVLLLSGPRSLRFMEYCVHFMNAGPRKRILALDAKDIKRTALIEDFAPDTLTGFPTFIFHAGPYLGKAAAGIRMVLVLGELITDDMERRLKKLFPNAVLCSGYSSAETGGLSKETCGFTSQRSYHPRDDVRIEVIDTDENGVGDVVVSRRVYGGMMIDRYAMGDLARLHTSLCQCGEKITIEILGRRDRDYIKLNGGLLIQAEFDRVAALFPAVIDDYRVIASMDDDQKGRLRLKVYSTRGGSDALRREVEERFAKELFLTHDKTLADLVAEGYFNPLIVEWTDEPFPPSHKSIRLSRV